MESDAKMVMFMCGGVAFLVSAIAATVGISAYVTNKQTIQCQEINKHRNGSEVRLLCGEIKR